MLSLHMRWSYPYTDTKLGRLQWYWSASILSITGYLYWSQPLVAPIELGLWTGPIPHWGGPIVTCPPPAPASQSTARCFFCTTTIGINIIISFIKLTTPSCLRTFISPQKYKALSFFLQKRRQHHHCLLENHQPLNSNLGTNTLLLIGNTCTKQWLIFRFSSFLIPEYVPPSLILEEFSHLWMRCLHNSWSHTDCGS